MGDGEVREGAGEGGSGGEVVCVVGMDLAYLTDVEGQWEKIATFCAGNPLVALEGDDLVLAGERDVRVRRRRGGPRAARAPAPSRA